MLWPKDHSYLALKGNSTEGDRWQTRLTSLSSNDDKNFNTLGSSS